MKDTIPSIFVIIVFTAIFGFLFWTAYDSNQWNQKYRQICKPYTVDSSYCKDDKCYAICGNMEIREVK